ncbi:MAG TPA: hypothetical protein VFJ10_03785 [Acidobacteriaceae bacterium]|jgi:hypothetical protein|nr:hypothetical protein [Acidobacteriaceae bacterium]
MKSNLIQMPSSMVLARGILRGMGREAPCELLLRKQPLDHLDRHGMRAYRYIEWTILHAPLDLPDGEYTVITDDGFTFPNTRMHGLWLHGELEEPNALEHQETA